MFVFLSRVILLLSFFLTFSFAHAHITFFLFFHHQVNGKGEHRSNALVGTNACGQKE